MTPHVRERLTGRPVQITRLGTFAVAAALRGTSARAA